VKRSVQGNIRKAAKRAARRAQHDPQQHMFNVMAGYGGTSNVLNRFSNMGSTHDSETQNPFMTTQQDLIDAGL